MSLTISVEPIGVEGISYIICNSSFITYWWEKKQIRTILLCLYNLGSYFICLHLSIRPHGGVMKWCIISMYHFMYTSTKIIGCTHQWFMFSMHDTTGYNVNVLPFNYHYFNMMTYQIKLIIGVSIKWNILLQFQLSHNVIMVMQT